MSENALDLQSQNRSFGRYLKKVREDRKLSLDAVEEMTMRYPGRVTKSHLSRIENGQAEPTFPRMFALSQVYGLPISSMAERFESDLRKASTPVEFAGRSTEDLLAELHALRNGGRHQEALVLCEAMLGREESVTAEALVVLRIKRADCLAQLWRHSLAKEECEDLLNSGFLSDEQRVQVLLQFTVCCYRLGKLSVAVMSLDAAEAQTKKLPRSHGQHAFFAALRGNVQMATSDFAQAAASFHSAVELFEQLGDMREATRMRLNFAGALIELKKPNEAKRQALKATQSARDAGHDRQLAHGINMLGKIAFDSGDLEEAEGSFLQSNVIARRGEFVPVVFCNCYYLWRIARDRNNDAAARSNERTLRAYIGRVEDYMREAREYRQYLAGGGS